MLTGKTLIRLGGCPGWSESMLGAQSFCWFCHAVAFSDVYSYCCNNWAATWQNYKMSMRPAKTQSAWASAQSDQSLLSAWRDLGALATHWVHSEDADQTGWMPRLIWVFAGRTVTLLVLSCGGSIIYTCYWLFYWWRSIDQVTLSLSDVKDKQTSLLM